jgi:outer membrane protein assembly factor BamB
MQIAKNKTMTTLLASILLLSMSLTLIAFPVANAQNIKYYKTYCYVEGAPDVIGVGQTVAINAWLSAIPPVTIDQGDTLPSWSMITVTVTAPDGTNETIGPLTSDTVGSAYSSFAPTATGTYQLQMFFAGQWKNTTTGNTYYQSSISKPYNITVQQEEVTKYYGAPLPTDYWTRPIDYQNRGWWSISGNWLGVPLGYGSGYNAQSRFNPYTTASNTAHIIWTKEIGLGGVAGGDFPLNSGVSYYTGSHYEARFTPTIVINGMLYYNLPLNTQSNTGGFVCVDIRTGEQKWWQNGTISMGQVLDMETPNQHGCIAYLWNLGGAFGVPSSYQVYDPLTGVTLYKYVNIKASGTITTDAQGDILIYMVGGTSPNRWMALWNSSYSPDNYQPMGMAYNGQYSWRPTGKSIDWSTGIQWNKTFSSDVQALGSPSISKICYFDDNSYNSMVIWRKTYTLDDGSQIGQDMAFDLTPGKELDVLWGPTNRTAKPSASLGIDVYPIGSGVYTEYVAPEMTYYGYSTTTGTQLWGPTEPLANPFAAYGGSAEVAYGLLFIQTYGGSVTCYNVTTGVKVWDYYTGSNPNTPYGHNPLWEGLFVADGKVFVSTYEHSQNNPPYEGAKMYAINATTGDLVWNLNGWYYGFGAVVADGYMVVDNIADNILYGIGKGQTDTIVTAPDTAQPTGTPILIKGAVTDQSPGSTAIDPKGTPCISDAYMTAWMEYLYMQQEMPTNATGVPVSIDAVDPNGNFIHLGDATSDASGFFNFQVNPDMLAAGSGTYKIIATFAGSESYWPSQSETAFTVFESAPTPTPSTQPVSVADMYFVPAIAGLFVLIIVVAIVLALLMLRKRP